jgi:hypothetical protein
VKLSLRIFDQAVAHTLHHSQFSDFSPPPTGPRRIQSVHQSTIINEEQKMSFNEQQTNLCDKSRKFGFQAERYA